jgi:hypothetical protein
MSKFDGLQRRAVIHQRSCRSQHPAGRAEVDISLLIISEVVPRVCAVLARRFVEHGHMWLDATLAETESVKINPRNQRLFQRNRSKADLTTLNCDVRSSPGSGHP